MKYITTAEQAESNAADQMQSLGYLDARTTPPGTDGGLDVIASKAIGQVKWRGAQVSRPEVQLLCGARGNQHHKEMCFFAASGYTTGAIAYADSVEMLLFTYEPHGQLRPANVHARRKLQAVTQQKAEDAGQAAKRWANQNLKIVVKFPVVVAKPMRATLDSGPSAGPGPSEHLAAPKARAAARLAGKQRLAEQLERRAARKVFWFDSLQARSAKDAPEKADGPNGTAGVLTLIVAAAAGYLGFLCLEHRATWFPLAILAWGLWVLAALALILTMSLFADARTVRRNSP